jgi:predicted small metal-binding protein
MPPPGERSYERTVCRTPGADMVWIFECRAIQPSCSFRSQSVGSREDAKRLGIIHLKNDHRINVDRDWERMVEKGIR